MSAIPRIILESLEGDVPLEVSETEKVTALAKRYDRSEADIKYAVDQETARVTVFAKKLEVPESTARAIIRDLVFLNNEDVIMEEVQRAMAIEFDLPESLITALLCDTRSQNEWEEDKKLREHAVRLAWKHDKPLSQMFQALKAQEDKEDDAGVVATLAKKYQLSFAAVTNLLRSARAMRTELQIQGCMTIPELRRKRRRAGESLAYLEGERRLTADIAALLNGERNN